MSLDVSSKKQKEKHEAGVLTAFIPAHTHSNLNEINVQFPYINAPVKKITNGLNSLSHTTLFT